MVAQRALQNTGSRPIMTDPNQLNGMVGLLVLVFLVNPANTLYCLFACNMRNYLLGLHYASLR